MSPRKSATRWLAPPKNGLIQIPAMTKRYGQRRCTLEFQWSRAKAAVIKKVFLSVPAFDDFGKPLTEHYAIPANSPTWHFSDYDPKGIAMQMHFCTEHQRPVFSFNTPLGTRFIQVSEMHSSVYVQLRFVPGEVNAEERRVINLYAVERGGDAT